MSDQSHLDSRYFVDDKVYNCPFCNRRHVSYHVYESTHFDWTDKKACTAFFVMCESCKKQSLHLTFQVLQLTSVGGYGDHVARRFLLDKNANGEKSLDDAFFFSVPTSFFALDERIPRELRELLTEAEGCLKSNFLTGASACTRKIIYELGKLSNAAGESYEERIKSLKALHSDVEPAFFDTLLTIQQATSAKVHENSSDGWEAEHLRVMLAAIAEVLHEIYVVPALRADRRKSVLDLKAELIRPKQGEATGEGK